MQTKCVDKKYVDNYRIINEGDNFTFFPKTSS